MVGRRPLRLARASALLLTTLMSVAGCKETAIIKIAADAAPIATSDVKIIEPGSCPPGQSLGCVNVYGRKVCNDEGTAYVELPCGSGELCLGDDQCIPAICIPNDRICVGIHRVGECVADGSRYESIESCGPGLTCEDGNCISTCTSGQKATTNVGCNYALVDLGNFESGPQNEATDKPVLVVVSNVSGSADAKISILSRKTGLPIEYPAADLIVPKQDLRTLLLPTKQALLTTAHSLDSWLLTSDQPITVSLINPENGLDVRSNDATLLFPTDALGSKYIVMGWESIWSSAQGFDAEGFPIYGFPSYVTIVATASGETTVQVTPASDVRAGKELDGSAMSRLPAGKVRTHVMREGEVLNYALEPRVGTGDFTGTTVESDRPIAVFFAHNCGFVPDINTPFCDHMGHQLAPIDTWGKTYIA
ncbi:MAG: IgGFc-binding protein, partial [Myxococcales bacterium]|nr:IgGFc-binding protein [Myxococcales bacterium]